MYQSRTIVTILISLWLLLSMFYYNVKFNVARSSTFNMDDFKNQTFFQKAPIDDYNGTEDFLINTPGCYIPNYLKTLQYKEANHIHQNCGQRAVFIKKISNDLIMFHIDDLKMKSYTEETKEMQCCYRFARRSTTPTKADSVLIYSPCVSFKNGTKAKLEREVITVTCVLESSKKSNVIYEDAYIILKKINKNINISKRDNKSWNVLLLGMDTMSRARIFSTMPQTISYLQSNNWLDYRGYQKVGSNTFPNLMSVLTGKKMSTVYKACETGMDKCNDLIMWTRFSEAGFATAYGEDFLRLPDTFFRYGGFKNPPTDHYMRPFFLTGEKLHGNIVCAKNKPSAKHLLDYAFHFAEAYKNDNFFGMFWLNSYSHNLNNIPSLIDEEIVKFFENLNDADVLNNTFVIFLSDHGIRYGEMRIPVESYYEERLPMLFIWIPLEFRKLYARQFYNIQINQNRLTTPYDLHAMLWSILKMSKPSVDVIRSEACPSCNSLFEEKSSYRTCADAGVNEKWCSCHDMTNTDRNETGVIQSLQLAVSYIQNKAKAIETTKCMKCYDLKLKTVLRNYSYKNMSNNKTSYVVAFVMSPGDVAYEATVQDDGNEFVILQPTETISPYNIRGNCVKNPNDRSYCVCENIKKCNKKQKH